VSGPQGISGGVIEIKEDTTTTYHGDTSGLPGGTLHLSPAGSETTVADADGGSGAGDGIFSPDTNLVGTNVVHFSLYDGACPLGGSPTQEGSTVNANLDSSGKVTGTSSLTLPPAGSYCLKTAYDGNTYYENSTDYDTITVNQSCTYTASFLQPLDASTPSMFIDNTVKRGRVIPVKVTIQNSCGGYVTDTSGNAVTISVQTATFTPKATDTVETFSDAGSSSGQTSAFRWVTDATANGGGYWIYNLDTSGFSVGTPKAAYVNVDSTKVLTNFAIVTPTK